MSCSQTSASISLFNKGDFWIPPPRFWVGVNQMVKGSRWPLCRRCQNHVQAPLLETGGSQPWIWDSILWEDTDAPILKRSESELLGLYLKPQVVCRTLKVIVYRWGRAITIRSIFFRLGSVSEPPGGLVKYRFLTPTQGSLLENQEA